MTYFGFLLRFLVVPILIFLGLEFWLSRKTSRVAVPKWPIFLMVLIALVYTTPWDNYLVATGVWWYDPELVTGIVLGWVPIEEYTFFVLQPIMVGLWLGVWARVFSLTPQPPLSMGEGESLSSPIGRGAGGEGTMSWMPVTSVSFLWLIFVGVLVSGWKPGTYLGLELAWALPPIILQLAFGVDILRRHWKLTLMGIVIPTIYLSGIDAFAIGLGTWTIDPAQSTGILLGGILPVEEFVFFLLTNVLVTLGLVLVWAPESQARLAALKHHVSRITPHGFAR